MSQDPDGHKKIKIMNISGRVVLSLSSAVTHENCKDLEKCVDDLKQQDKTEIILDCKNIEFWDSAALELFSTFHQDFMQMGGSFRLYGLNDVCKDILTATRMVNTLLVHKDIQGALKHAL